MESYHLNSISSSFTLIREDLQSIESLMRAQFEESHPDIYNVVDMILSSGGKRIRPAITLLVGQMLNAPTDLVIKLAAGVELLHTATLVHDDLINGSILRRNIPSLNSYWPPEATVLTGDLIFAKAAKLVAAIQSMPVISRFTEVLNIIVNSEVTQLFSSQFQIDKSLYYKRIYAKTASLFETSAFLAALISPVNHDIIDSMRIYGYGIGMAFQIIDDVLDFIGDETSIGKPIGNDLFQGIITLPTLYYIETHTDDLNIQSFSIDKFTNNKQNIEHLVESICNSTAIQLSKNDALQFINRSISNLNIIPHCPQRDSLEVIAQYVVNRKE